VKSPAAKFSISLLGPFKAEVDGEPVRSFRSTKVRALLAYLAVESQRPWTRSMLGDLLWPDLPDKEAQSNLRNAISNLRQVIGDRQRDSPFLLVSQGTLQYNQTTTTWLDVKAFMDLVTTASQAEGSVHYKDNIDHLKRALALYRGDFMEGFSITSAPFEEWVLLKSEQFKQVLLQALRLLVAGYERLGELDQALNHARHWVELEPWEEAAHRHLMIIFMHKGQRNAALAQYEACCQQLNNDLSIEPELETTQLYEQIRAGQIIPGFHEIESLAVSHPAPLPEFLKTKPLPSSERPFFVGRQIELERLQSELEQAVQGNGRILFIIGDPGSGKTALLTEFSRWAMNKVPDLIVAQGQCNAYTGEADPYFPFLEITQTLSGDMETRVLGGTLTQEHAMRLWRFLPKVISTVLEDGPDLINRFFLGRVLLAYAQVAHGVKPELLARLRAQVERTNQQSSPTRLQQVTLFNQFVKVLGSLSQHNPLVLILDDLQWIDTDSVNLLFHLGRRLSGSRILLLGAYRSEDVALGRQGERHPLEGVIHELQMGLGDIHIDLMQNEGVDFVEALLDSEPNQLSMDFRRLLHRHTAGHPLFTIELLRGMQLRGDIYRNELGKWVESTQLNWDKLPVRVEAVIAERIGHLPKDYQEMLSAASVEGEQFTAEILASILEKDEQEVIQILSQEIGKRHRLVVAQSCKQIREQTLSIYRFRHFLYQKYLYQHLDQVEKARLHGKMGSVLEAVYLQDLVKYPEINHQLARHFDLADLVEKAVPYYIGFGKYAIQLGANREAITHFERTLRLVKTLPDSEKRDRLALSLHLSLGPPLTATRGWAALELETNYRQAEELCQKMGDDAQLVPALWLLAVYRLGRSEHATVDRLVERLSSLAQKIGDPGLLCLADLQVSPLYQGRLTEARQSLTHASLPRDADQQRSLAYQYGMSPSVLGLAYLSNCLWLLGFPEQAAQRSQQACDLAAEINVPMTTCYAVSRKCWQHAFAGEIDAISSEADKLLQITRQHELRNFELAAIFFIHWVNNQVGDSSIEEIEKMCQAMEEYQSLGTVLNRTTFLMLFAQACGKAGQIERGLAALDESITLGERTGECWFEAESYRIKGELLVRQAENSPRQAAQLDEAENCFQIARQVASQQGAKMLELRAITSLCRLWQRQGQGKDGILILSEIVSYFTEGLDGLEISRAKALLLELYG
jgi:predicted ATPase/DNA-binding SARP family transcriptional activator